MNDNKNSQKTQPSFPKKKRPNIIRTFFRRQLLFVSQPGSDRLCFAAFYETPRHLPFAVIQDLQYLLFTVLAANMLEIRTHRSLQGLAVTAGAFAFKRGFGSCCVVRRITSGGRSGFSWLIGRGLGFRLISVCVQTATCEEYKSHCHNKQRETLHAISPLISAFFTKYASE
jgi:hypothetical protein